MATCATYSLKGVGQECLGSAAGIKRLLIGLDREWVVTEDTSTAATPHSVTISAATTGSPEFYEYYITEESSSLTSQLNINNQNGVKYYSNVVNATFIRMRPEKHIEMLALANERLVIIVQDNNGTYWVLQNASATSETAQSGQAADDLSGYQIELTSREATLPFTIDAGNLPAIDELRVYN